MITIIMWTLGPGSLALLIKVYLYISVIFYKFFLPASVIFIKKLPASIILIFIKNLPASVIFY